MRARREKGEGGRQRGGHAIAGIFPRLQDVPPSLHSFLPFFLLPPYSPPKSRVQNRRKALKSPASVPGLGHIVPIALFPGAFSPV